MTEYPIIIRECIKCDNPPKQVFFKRFVFKESVKCNDGDELKIEIDRDADTASVKAVKIEDVNPHLDRLEILECSKTCLIDNTHGHLNYGSKRLMDKWEFEIKKLEYIIKEE